MNISTQRYLTICLLLVMSLVAVDRFVDYQARHAGRVAGESARQEIEQLDIARSQYNELKRLLANEDLKALLAQKLEDEGIDSTWVLNVIMENSSIKSGSTTTTISTTPTTAPSG